MADLHDDIAQNSINGKGTRLVLGEGMTPLTETRQHGGRYILVHPEVVRKLEENNIDPFLIYEAALRRELDSKIPQIEYVGGSVAELLKASRGKPDRQFPIHVRQLLWLEKNAGSYGYQQSGNGWKLI